MNGKYSGVRTIDKNSENVTKYFFWKIRRLQKVSIIEVFTAYLIQIRRGTRNIIIRSKIYTYYLLTTIILIFLLLFKLQGMVNSKWTF